MLQKRIFRLGQNLNQRFFIKVFKRRHNWQTANKFRDQTKFDQIFRLKFGKKFTNFAVIWIADISPKTNASTGMAASDQLVETGKGSPTDEQNIGGINLQKFLLGMLAPPLRWHGRNGAFHNLQQSLLNTLARYITGD